MKKYITAVFLSLSLLMLASCNNESVVLKESKTYEITSDIKSIDVQIDAAEFIIEQADKFSVESNLKNLTVTEKDGVLSVVEENVFSSNYKDAKLKLSIPKNAALEDVDIETGAANLTAPSLTADSLELKLGAGKVQFGNLTANSNADIKGGAGDITIINGNLKNLTLELGVGSFDLTAALLGNSELNFGVGESNLTILGSKSDYKLDIEKGIGSISIDEEAVSESGNDGNGQNSIKITGGVGETNVFFKEK